METNKFTPIEAKTQADYDAIAGAFSQSREGMQWPEVEREIETLPKGASLLDVGCGMGRLYASASKVGLSYAGVDISEKQLREARQLYPDALFHQGSMLSLPFADGSFDAVFCVAALHHLMTPDERWKAMAEMMRVLKPGGRLVVTVMALWQPKFWPLFFKKREGLRTVHADVRRVVKWNDVFLPWRWKVQDPVYRYYHAFRAGELLRLASRAGLANARVRYVDRGARTLPWRAKNLVLTGKKSV